VTTADAGGQELFAGYEDSPIYEEDDSTLCDDRPLGGTRVEEEEGTTVIKI